MKKGTALLAYCLGRYIGPEEAAKRVGVPTEVFIGCERRSRMSSGVENQKRGGDELW